MACVLRPVFLTRMTEVADAVAPGIFVPPAPCRYYTKTGRATSRGISRFLAAHDGVGLQRVGKYGATRLVLFEQAEMRGHGTDASGARHRRERSGDLCVAYSQYTTPRPEHQRRPCLDQHFPGRGESAVRYNEMVRYHASLDSILPRRSSRFVRLTILRYAIDTAPPLTRPISFPISRSVAREPHRSRASHSATCRASLPRWPMQAFLTSLASTLYARATRATTVSTVSAVSSRRSLPPLRSPRARCRNIRRIRSTNR